MARFSYRGPFSQQRKPRPDVVGSFTAVANAVPDVFAGFWDITEPGGALSINNVEPLVNNDPIHRIVQLLDGSTATDIVFKALQTEDDREMFYRKDFVCMTGNSFTRKPVCFYPYGYFTDAIANQTQVELFRAVSTLGVPAETPLMEMTTIICGVKMIHELGITQEMLNATDPNGFTGFPIPEEPGTLIITSRLEGDVSPSKPIMQVYINGVVMEAESVFGNIASVSHTTGISPDTFLQMFAMPCWGTQKIGCITRVITADEAAFLHQVMYDSMEVFE